jgi:hypothetical protein
MYEWLTQNSTIIRKVIPLAQPLSDGEMNRFVRGLGIRLYSFSPVLAENLQRHGIFLRYHPAFY